MRVAGPLLAGAMVAAGPAAADMFGPGYPPCGQRGTTIEIVDCIAAKTSAWDKRLNTAYQALQGVIDPAQREPLRAAQRLWLQYRNANCGFYGAQDGTIRQIKAAECMRAMTEDRARELEQGAKG